MDVEVLESVEIISVPSTELDSQLNKAYCAEIGGIACTTCFFFDMCPKTPPIVDVIISLDSEPAKNSVDVILADSFIAPEKQASEALYSNNQMDVVLDRVYPDKKEVQPARSKYLDRLMDDSVEVVVADSIAAKQLAMTAEDNFVVPGPVAEKTIVNIEHEDMPYISPEIAKAQPEPEPVIEVLSAYQADHDEIIENQEPIITDRCVELLPVKSVEIDELVVEKPEITKPSIFLSDIEEPKRKVVEDRDAQDSLAETTAFEPEEAVVILSEEAESELETLELVDEMPESQVGIELSLSKEISKTVDETELIREVDPSLFLVDEIDQPDIERFQLEIVKDTTAVGLCVDFEPIIDNDDEIDFERQFIDQRGIIIVRDIIDLMRTLARFALAG